MSLDDLKLWMGSNHQRSESSYSVPSHVLGVRQENLPLAPKLNLSQKPNSNTEKNPYQSEITQRLSSRSQREINQNK